MKNRILVIDQGTSSTRVSLYTPDGTELAMEQKELSLQHPQDGWAELSPREVSDSVLLLIDRLLSKNPGPVSSVGITNQRETVIVWDRETGEPVYPAIVWLDRRTATLCHALADKADLIQQKTGLCLDPYFSATKIQWILDNVPNARAGAESGRLIAGTIDTYLIYLLSEGSQHVTDATNASRTMLFNIHTQAWDQTLCTLFDIPLSMLPAVRDSQDSFGPVTIKSPLYGVPIRGVAGDQQAALVGQGCLSPGMAKCTYGTGLFLVMNTGSEPIVSRSKLLATVGYRLGGRVSYAIEGSSFVAGAALRWARDKLQLFDTYEESDGLAASVPYQRSPYFIPAFHGLGAPYWNPDVRGALYGLTQDTGRAEIVSALMLASAYQTRDLLEAIRRDGFHQIQTLRVDGGMTASNWFCQALTDLLKLPVERAACRESTSRGAALLANDEPPSSNGVLPNSDRLFTPRLPPTESDLLYEGWLSAINRTLQ